MKEHKGFLANCKEIRPNLDKKTLEAAYGPNLGYYLSCNFVNHPSLRDDPGTYGRTSLIVKHTGDEIETLNSRYTITSWR